VATNYGDFQLELYVAGLSGEHPGFPVSREDLRARAAQALSPEVLSYVAGGAGNEFTQEVNVTAFDRYGLMPRMLAGAAQRDLSIELFGLELPTPLLLAPVGVIGLCSQDGHGDIATAQASAESGVPMIASTLTVDPMEEVAPHAGDTPGFFQLYTPADRDLAQSFVRRAESCGYQGIIVTLDTQILGWRPRDLTLASFPQLKGKCLANYFTDEIFRAKLETSPEDDPRTAAFHWALGFSDPGLSWDDLGWLRSLTSLPLILKGICSPDDARRAIDGGVDGIYCSNHGGRQANGGAAAIDMLPGVVKAVNGRVPVIFDSGVRGGEHVVKALALGATAVGIGRPYAWGLALGGPAGIVHVLKCLLAEADLLMAVDGYASIEDLTPDALITR
jgi:isopentenyl diphosphate isomerase/L-lactate dehydrogenase-like FMN-dependent dehydrogenase